MMKRRLIAAALVSLALAQAACLSPVVSPTPAAERLLRPTAHPTAMPGPTPVPAPRPEPTQPAPGPAAEAGEPASDDCSSQLDPGAYLPADSQNEPRLMIHSAAPAAAS